MVGLAPLGPPYACFRNRDYLAPQTRSDLRSAIAQTHKSHGILKEPWPKTALAQRAPPHNNPRWIGLPRPIAPCFTFAADADIPLIETGHFVSEPPGISNFTRQIQRDFPGLKVATHGSRPFDYR